jgi:hypothetical protein
MKYSALAEHPMQAQRTDFSEVSGFDQHSVQAQYRVRRKRIDLLEVLDFDARFVLAQQAIQIQRTYSVEVSGFGLVKVSGSDGHSVDEQESSQTWRREMATAMAASEDAFVALQTAVQDTYLTKGNRAMGYESVAAASEGHRVRGLASKGSSESKKVLVVDHSEGPREISESEKCFVEDERSVARHFARISAMG